jgi:uncharacterized protein (TIGR00661 family)
LKILYGVCGDGMGHATRAAVVARHLEDKGHKVRLASSGRALRYLEQKFPNRTMPIIGLSAIVKHNGVAPVSTFFHNLFRQVALAGINHMAFGEVAISFRPDMVLSDFDPWSARCARVLSRPLIALDNIHFITRCAHPTWVVNGDRNAADLTSSVVSAMVPDANQYLVLSFVDVPISQPRTSLHMPVLRDEILDARKTTKVGEHVVMYFNHKACAEPIMDVLKQLSTPFRVYGQDNTTFETKNNVMLCPFDESSFIEDMKTAKAVVGGAGFTLTSEAIALKKPMLAVPFGGHFEQILNANYVDELRYGERADRLTAEVLERFLARAPTYQKELDTFEHPGNADLFAALDGAMKNAEKSGALPFRDYAAVEGPA